MPFARNNGLILNQFPPTYYQLLTTLKVFSKGENVSEPYFATGLGVLRYQNLLTTSQRKR
jgi:hypothetical protein